MTNMNYEVFRNKMVAAIEAGELGEEFSKVRVGQITKNNTVLDSITLGGTEGVCPTIYPEKIYEAAMASASEEETMGEILARALDDLPTIYPESIYEAAMSSASEEDTMGEILTRALDSLREMLASTPTPVKDDITSIITDWNRAKDLVQLRVIGSENNPYLEDKVYTEPAPGLATIFYIPLQGIIPAGNGTASTAVTDALMETWGISFDNLYDTAVANTTAESEVKGMSDILKEMMPPELVEAGLVDLPEEEAMLVITNKSRVYGNGGVLCPDVMARCAKELGTDKLAVLPSSTHELIVVPGNMAENPAELTSMVGEVNSSEVAPEERVCDMAYFYDVTTGAITPISAGMAA